MAGISISLNELIQLQYHSRGLSLLSKRPKRHLQQGGYDSKIRGRGMEFDEVRHYQAGDDIRHMEWRITARTGEPHIKLYHEEKERPVYLLVDLGPRMFFGTQRVFKSVLAAETAALLAWRASQLGDRVGGLIFSGAYHQELKPRAGTRGVLPLLKTLANQEDPYTEETDPHDLTHALQRLQRLAKPGSLCIIISDFRHLEEATEHQLHEIRRHQDVIACYTYDPMEHALPQKGDYQFSDGKQFLQLSAQEDLLNHFQETADTKLKKLQKLMKSCRISFYELSTQLSAHEQLTHGGHW